MAIKLLFRRNAWILFIGLLAVLFILDLSLGTVKIPFSKILSIIMGNTDDSVSSTIIWNFRLTKALTCLLAGAALAVGGLQMQTLFRNPLAGPDVLGLSSGASLAVSVIFMAGNLGIHLSPAASPWTIAIAASIGSAVVLFIVLGIAKKMFDHASILIIGLMMAAITSSIVSVLQFISKAEEQQYYLIWSFGNIGGLNWMEIKVLTLVIIIGILLAFTTTKALNSWLLGNSYAESLGINIKKSRIIIIVSTSLLAGGVTAFCGPIAFVGLAVPHLTKLLIPTSDHKKLIPAVIISGGILMLCCDILSQMPGGSYVLPINAITALIGAPVVIWIIIRKRKIHI
jgi:iron complex transport system permease protein